MGSNAGVSAPTTIAPWLTVRDSAEAVEFYKSAFGAQELFRLGPPESVIARLSVEGAEFWVGDESPQHFNFSPESLGGSSVRIIFRSAPAIKMPGLALVKISPVSLV